MGYLYETERPWLFTEEGQVALIKTRDAAFKLCESAGCFVGMKALKNADFGDTWKALAILDRLVEMGDLVKVNPDAWAQDWIFRRPR